MQYRATLKMIPRKNQNPKINSAAFTLTGLLVIAAISVIIVTLGIKVLDLGGKKGQTKDPVRESTLKELTLALSTYRTAESKYPLTTAVRDSASKFRTQYVATWPDGKPEYAVYEYSASGTGAEYVLLTSFADLSGCYKYTSVWKQILECAPQTCILNNFACENSAGKSIVP
jgi:hypothetical protein